MSNVSQLLRSSLAATAPVVTHGSEDFDDLILAEELADTQLELDESAMLLDVATTTESQMEALIAGIEALTVETPLTAREAALMNVAIDGITAPWGGSDALGMQVAGVESFEVEGGRAAATTYGIEGIKSALETVWQSIKDFIKKSVHAVTMFFNKHFALVGRVVKRAKSLKLKADAIPGEHIQKEAKVEVGKSLSYVALDGKIPTDLSAQLAVTTKFVDSFTKVDLPKATEAFVGPMAKTEPTEDPAKEKSQADAMAAEFQKMIDDVMGTTGINIAFENDALLGNGNKGVRSAELLGEKALVISDPTSIKNVDSLEGLTTYLNSFKFGFMSFAAATMTVTKASAVPAMDKKDIAELCEAAGKLAESVYEYKDKNKDAEEINKAIDKAGDIIVRVGKDTAGVKGWVIGKVMTKALRKVGATFIRPQTDLVNHCTRVANSALNVADKCIANYEAKPAK